MAFGDLVGTVKTAESGGANALSASLDANPVAGNLIVIAHFTGAANSQPGTGMTESVAATDATNTDQGAIYHRVAQSGDGASWGIAADSVDQQVLVLAQREGPMAASPLDKTATDAASDNPTTKSSGTTAATAQADEIAVAAFTSRGGRTVGSYSNSFAALGAIQNDLGFGDAAIKGIQAAVKVLSATGAQETTQTYSESPTRAMGMIATFKKDVPAATPAYEDHQSRFRLLAGAFRDARSRFRLLALGFRDARARFALFALAHRDAAARHALKAPDYADHAARFLLTAVTVAYRDVQARFRVGRTGQLARPFADAAVGGWTGEDGRTSDLWQSVDEAIMADHADYAQSNTGPTGTDTLRLGLTNGTTNELIDRGINTGHALRLYVKKDQAAGPQVNLTAVLMAGGVDVKSQAITDLSADVTLVEMALSSAEVDTFRANNGYRDAEVRLEKTQA